MSIEVLFCFSVPPCPCVAAQASGPSSAPSASSPSRRSARSICTKRYIRVSSPHIHFKSSSFRYNKRFTTRHTLIPSHLASCLFPVFRCPSDPLIYAPSTASISLLPTNISISFNSSLRALSSTSAHRYPSAYVRQADS